MEKQYKYFAFISYNSKDTEWGKRVQKKLEHYRMPATLCSEHGWERTPIKPVFFVLTDIQPGGLTEELQERLKASRNLIVICSPNSAKSQWVGKEIEFFHQLGRTKQIHFFIVEGTPHSGNEDTECFNPVIDSLGLPEILGANIHEKIYRWPWLNKERAYVQLISKLLGVEFDAIWQRHKRLVIQRMMTWGIGLVAVLVALIGVWTTNQPVDISVQLSEASIHNDNLPPMREAVVTMTLDNETKSDTVHSLDAIAKFTNIPHRFLNNKARIRVECRNWLSVDTTVLLSRQLHIMIRRNPDVFGRVNICLWDSTLEKRISHTEVTVDGYLVKSDAEGMVRIDIPLDKQKTAYPISSSAVLINDKNITMPCGPDDAVIVRKLR